MLGLKQQLPQMLLSVTLVMFHPAFSVLHFHRFDLVSLVLHDLPCSVMLFNCREAHTDCTNVDLLPQNSEPPIITYLSCSLFSNTISLNLYPYSLCFDTTVPWVLSSSKLEASQQKLWTKRLKTRDVVMTVPLSSQNNCSFWSNYT